MKHDLWLEQDQADRLRNFQRNYRYALMSGSLTIGWVRDNIINNILFIYKRICKSEKKMLVVYSGKVGSEFLY